MTNDDDITRRFFLESESTQLVRIYQWARARYAAPWAVLGGVLARVAATTEPSVQLPGVIGGRASLNLLCAFVSASGGGKGISDKVARLAWPVDIVERPIGSGEGIAETFRPPDKETENAERITRAIITVPEIDTLAGLADKQGSILLATLKSAAMGELIGQANASRATTRIVKDNSYRVCMSVGVQYGHGSVLFNDSTGGTPQRFLWFPTTDPNMPADRIGDPAPLDTNLPSWAPGPDKVVEIGYGPPEIAETILGAHLARQRGAGDALDGHWMLARCKVAAVLAIMHHRSVVSAQDWELSELVMQVSDTTRQTLLDHAKQAARANIKARAIARATGEEFYENSRAVTVRNSVLRMLERDGEQSGSDLRRRQGTGEKRLLFDQVIDLLRSDGLVTRVSGEQKGYRYRLTGHRDQGGHPAFSQVSDGDQGGHRDQLKNETGTVNPQLTVVADDPAPPTDQTAEVPVKSPQPTACGVCWIELPASAVGPVCADCADAPAPPQPATVPRQTASPGDLGGSGSDGSPSAEDAPAGPVQQTRRVGRTAPQIRAAMKRARGDKGAS